MSTTAASGDVRVAIITPESPNHHRHFCAYLAERHQVVAVLHPGSTATSRAVRLRRLRKRFARLGPVYGALQALSAAPAAISGWNRAQALQQAEQRFYADAHAAYVRLGIDRLAQRVADINSADAIARLAAAKPDVVLCLGGPIYRQPLIDSVETMINYHSGISPLYNGASTVMFAFANGQPHLCGGTLMTMSSVVDGGGILAHYLPEIVADDDPAELFMKTVGGAATLASSFVSDLERGASFTSIPQPPPVFYYTSDAWTLYQTQLVRRQLARRTAERFVRAEQIVRYWHLAPDEAKASLVSTIGDLLGLR